jgi:hypothetical protein
MIKGIKKNYQGVVLLIIIAVTLSILKLVYIYKGDNLNDQDISPTPSIINTQSIKSTTIAVNTEEFVFDATPSANSTSSAKSNYKDYPLWQQLPYQGKGFEVEKYIAPMTLQMKITTATESGAIKDVTVWINSFGDAIGQHKIVISK